MKKSLSILIIFLCLLTTLTNAQELNDKKNKSTEINGTNKIDGVTATGDKMTVKDEDGNILMEVTDEGEGGSVYLKPIPGLSSNYTSRLYNIGTQLYWNGFQLGTNESAGGWTDDGSVVRLSTNTDIVSLGININTPNTLYTLQAEVNTDIAGKAAIFGCATSLTSPTFAGYGIYGLRMSEGAGGSGVFGESKGAGNGVYGKTDDEFGYGIFGENIDNGYAGYFLGKGYFSGNVGIGTSSPTAELHVTGDDGVLFEGTYGSGTVVTIPKEGYGGRMMWYPKKAAFRAGYVNGDQWNDSNIGNLSIAMGFSNSASGYSSTALGDNTIASGFVSTAMGQFTKAQSIFSTSIGYYNIGGGSPSSLVGTDPLFEVGNGIDNNNRSNALTILKNGNIGIGTDISLASNVRLTVEGNENDYALIKINQKGTKEYAGLSVQRTDTEKWFIGMDRTTDNLQFRNSGSTNLMTIKEDGNVGIGTTSPNGKLDVNGSIYQRGGELYSDYVFEDDYELETIADHTEYMWREKHLPAIPKAKVDEEGREIVEVGSHRRGIVEELEKAHIYISQLEKRISKLERIIMNRK